MRNFVLILFLLICPIPACSQIIDVGTNVPVRILSNIHSDEQGSVVACVENDLYDGDRLVIKRGTPVEVNVIRKESSWAGRRGTVTLNFISTKTVNQERVALQGEYRCKGRNRRGLSLGLGVGIGVAFWPFLGFLAIYGGDAMININTIVQDVVVAYPIHSNSL